MLQLGIYGDMRNTPMVQVKATSFEDLAGARTGRALLS
jgi:hypothetical protein